MKSTYIFIGIAAVALLGVGILAGVTFLSGSEGSDSPGFELTGLAALHEVVGEQDYSAAPRKQAVATCDEGEIAISGGYILAGEFQTVDAPAPDNLPVVTESTPASTLDSGVVNTWSIVAIAPSDFSGSWGLTPKAVCVEPS
jgi:hypothetical protein